MYNLEYGEPVTNIDEYIAVTNLSHNIKDKADISDILVLPKKFTDEKYYYAQETIDFVKFCREQDDKHQIGILDNEDVMVRSLHSADIWLPVIWISESILLPLVIGLITSYIYDKIKGKGKEPTTVDVTIQINDKKKGINKSIHYNGDATTFKDTFDKIDINKLK